MERFEKLGVIGTGAMGRALIQGIVPTTWDAGAIQVYDIRPEAIQQLQERVDRTISSADTVRQMADEVDVILLSVKPKDVARALSDLETRSIRLISIAAGVSIDELKEHVGTGSQIIRVMPNTPAQVGTGMSFLAPDDTVEEPFLDVARTILGSVGIIEVVSEDQMDAVTALSGSGPAYVYYLLEALHEAGIYLGLAPDVSLRAALQTIRGAAELAHRENRSPSSLRLDVSSPGGTTVEAIKHFDQVGLKGAIVEGVRKACQKSRSM